MSLHSWLIHAPKEHDFYGPLGPSSSINTMAVGLPALAASLSETGREVELLHLGIQRYAEPGFELGREAKRLRPRLAGLSLHWHPQTWDVIEAARALKAASPETFVLLGGFTASIFHREILEQHPEIDGVIRGDGELPLRELARCLDEQRGLEEVPNLSFRGSAGVVENAQTWVATSQSMAHLGYERFDLLRHHQHYIRRWSGQHYMPRRRLPATLMRMGQRLFGGAGHYMVLPVGRGCSVNCAWCGGGWSAHKSHSGRTGYSRVPPGRIAALITRAVALGFQGVHACFDPTPKDPSYWLEAFQQLREGGTRTEMFFESFALPHPQLLESLRRTFRRRVVAISPESPDPSVRRRVRGFSFSNEELIESARQCGEHEVDLILCFGFGLPWEKEDALAQARELARACQEAAKGSRVLLRSFPIHMEPGAPWALHPERYGIQPTRQSFQDYLRAHTPGYSGPETGLGYVHPSYFSERSKTPQEYSRRVQEAACRELCPLPPGPTLGRHTCRALRSLQPGSTTCH